MFQSRDGNLERFAPLYVITYAIFSSKENLHFGHITKGIFYGIIL